MVTKQQTWLPRCEVTWGHTAGWRGWLDVIRYGHRTHHCSVGAHAHVLPGMADTHICACGVMLRTWTW